MVHFHDRVRHSSYTFVYQPSDDIGAIDPPVLTYLTRQPKFEEDHSLKENRAPTANSNGSNRPGGSRCVSTSPVCDVSLSARAHLRRDRNHRSSLPITSSSASWHLPGEKSSDSSRSPTVENFNLLFHRPITRKELRWDLVKPLSMSRINNWLNCVSFLDGPALGSSVFSAQIHFRESHLWRLEHLWGPIIVRTTKGLDQPITLRRLFDEIFNYFQYPIKDTDSTAEAVEMRGEDVVDSWCQRNYNTYQPRSPYVHDPFIRRVDFLLGFSLFRKLRLDSVSGQSCHLVLSIR
jgi:hypothetical protein